MQSPLPTDQGLGHQGKGNEGHLPETTIQRGNFMGGTTVGYLKAKTVSSSWGLFLFTAGCSLQKQTPHTNHLI